MTTELYPAASSVAAVELHGRMVDMKRKAYAMLDQALSADSTPSSSSQSAAAMGLYQKALGITTEAIELYRANSDRLGKLEEAVVLYNQLVRMRAQTVERLEHLQQQQPSTASAATPASHNSNYNNQQKQQQPSTLTQTQPTDREFLELADEVLSDDEFLIVDDDNETNAAKLQKRLAMDDMFAKASEICRVDNGVQLFYIANDGSVSTPSHPTTLSIYAFNDDQNTASASNDQLLGFVRVGSWVYPLMKNISPAMKTNFNAYIFPNEEEAEQNEKAQKSSNGDKLVIRCNFVGITFSNSTKDQQETFEDILANYGSLIYQDQSVPSGVKQPIIPPPRPTPAPSQAVVPAEKAPFLLDERAKPKDDKALEKKLEEEKPATDDTSQESGLTSDYIAKQVQTGADYVVRGVSATAGYASYYINRGGEKIKSNVTPNEQPTNVAPSVQKTIQGVRYGTHLTVRVSSFLLNKLGSIASSTAKTVAPYIREGTVSLLSKSGVAGNKSSANGYVDGFCTVTGSGIQGFVKINDSLEDAAKQLAKNITEQTVTVADYKYGPSVAKATENGLYSVGNVAVCANNVRHLKVVRTIAKATAKETIHPSDKKQAPQIAADSKKAEKSIENKK